MSQDALDQAKGLLKDLDNGEKAILRDQINIDLTGQAEGRLGSADISADDEKKKYIAQHGNPNAQPRAQDVPEPESDELKDLQNKVALEQNRTGNYDNNPGDLDDEKENEQKYHEDAQRHADEVTGRQRDKLKS